MTMVYESDLENSKICALEPTRWSHQKNDFLLRSTVKLFTNAAPCCGDSSRARCTTRPACCVVCCMTSLSLVPLMSCIGLVVCVLCVTKHACIPGFHPLADLPAKASQHNDRVSVLQGMNKYSQSSDYSYSQSSYHSYSQRCAYS